MSMSLRAGCARLIRRAVGQVEGPFADLPAFLCPALIQTARSQYSQRRNLHSTPERTNQLQARSIIISDSIQPLRAATANRLPPQCSGCGALSQTVDKNEPGFFDLKRKSVKQYLTGGTLGPTGSDENVIFEESLQRAKENDPQFAEKFGFDVQLSRQKTVKTTEPPICERCHNLKHHETGVSIHHPSLQSIQDTLFESPYKYNHVYHIIDAADFPMSLIPGLYKLLHLTPQRTLNRRSKTGRFYHGKKTEISFIITRSDLLAPKKEQVDSMMPYLREVLRDSLGRTAADVRLGNIRCLSAKQGWWTKELKEDIWGRGGGGWMVGKVNVGKSQLFHEVFPKGRRGAAQGKPLPPLRPLDGSALVKANPISVEGKTASFPSSSSKNDIQELRRSLQHEKKMEEIIVESPEAENGTPAEFLTSTIPVHTKTEDESIRDSLDSLPPPTTAQDNDDYLDLQSLDTYSLLPPAQIETDYPSMPLVSSLPGTTASPIRVPFGNGKGELIDLPGLSRGDLELHVQPEHRSSLVMSSRIRPEQQSIKPGQSLLLGGFIRITPTTPDIVFLAYSFNPLHPHLTSTEKAIGTQTQTRESNVENIALPGTGDKIASAGTFHLKWDVTKQRAGPMTARAAANIKTERLPFRVVSTDILIEGCGWVELTAQIRKRAGEMSEPPPQPHHEHRSDGDWEPVEREYVNPQWPTVEVFSPEGKFIAARRPLNAWLNFAQKPSEKRAKSRPRRSMKGMKKLTRQRVRATS